MKSIARKLSLRKNKEEQPSPSAAQISSKASSNQASSTTPAPVTEENTESKTMAPNELPKTFKAAVIEGQQKPLKIQDLPMYEVKQGEIVVKVKACGVCHSDHHVLNGDMGPPYVLLL